MKLHQRSNGIAIAFLGAGRPELDTVFGGKLIAVVIGGPVKVIDNDIQAAIAAEIRDGGAAGTLGSRFAADVFLKVTASRRGLNPQRRRPVGKGAIPAV